MRVVARLRGRGHTLEEIKRASDSGQLAVGPIENLLRGSDGRYSMREVARATGLSTDMIERILGSLGLSELTVEPMSEEDVEILKYVATMLDVGLPPVAFLQLARVYARPSGRSPTRRCASCTSTYTSR